MNVTSTLTTKPSYPRVENSGFFTKTQKVEYQVPKMEEADLGAIPRNASLSNAPGVADGFYPCTKETPKHFAGYSNATLRNEQPELDDQGNPILETKTRNIYIPGPKGEALGYIAGGTFLGGITGAMPGMLITGLAMVGDILGAFGAAGPGRIRVEDTVKILAWGAGIGATLGAGAAISSTREMFSNTNTLDWKSVKMESKELVGFTAKKNSKKTAQLFVPEYKQTDLGSYMEPSTTIHYPKEI